MPRSRRRRNAVVNYDELVLATVGLVSFWALDERSGTTATDAKGVNHGTYVNSPTLGQGPLVANGVRAVTFTRASNQYADLAAVDMTSWDGVTIEAWVRHIGAFSGGIIESLLAFEGTGVSAKLQFYDGANPDRLTCVFGTGVVAEPSPSSTATTYHVAATTDKTTIRLYRNGIQRNSGGHAGALPNGTGRIGDNPVNNRQLNGTLDAVALYRRALTPGEIAEHYMAGLG